MILQYSAAAAAFQKKENRNSSYVYPIHPQSRSNFDEACNSAQFCRIAFNNELSSSPQLIFSSSFVHLSEKEYLVGPH